jgi:hypothetical protein
MGGKDGKGKSQKIASIFLYHNRINHSIQIKACMAGNDKLLQATPVSIVIQNAIVLKSQVNEIPPKHQKKYVDSIRKAGNTIRDTVMTSSAVVYL